MPLLPGKAQHFVGGDLVGGSFMAGRIVVTLDDDATTPGAVTDPKEPGGLTWKVPVPEGGKKEIALAYRVRSPRSVVLAGLE